MKHALKECIRESRGLYHLISKGQRQLLLRRMPSLEEVQEQSVLTPTVRRLILSQLEQLTPMGRALLRASTILGQGASFDALCRVADLKEREALAALKEVLRQQLLRESSAEDGREVHSSVESNLFGHDKIREVTYTEMGLAQRCLFHRRALAVCQAQGRPAAKLAHHALAAGLSEQAVGFSLPAGDKAKLTELAGRGQRCVPAPCAAAHVL